MSRIILILSSMPRDMAPLRVHEEIREIEEAIRRSRYRDAYQVVVRLGVRARDLHRVLLEHHPAIVHFAGHGHGEQGLVLEDDHGDSLLVSSEHLAEMLGHFRHEIECVMLNACHSEVQIAEIAKHIPAVIGMHKSLDDRAAVLFAMAFYDSLANGKSIPSAYRVACSTVSVNGLALDRIAVLAVPDNSVGFLGAREVPDAHISQPRGIGRPSEPVADSTSVSRDESEQCQTICWRWKDANSEALLRNTLPKILEHLVHDPVPFLLRVGVPPEISRGEDALERWSYVCSWLLEQGLHGISWTLQLVAEVQERHFQHELSQWSETYIHSLESELTGSSEGSPLAALYDYICQEERRWAELRRKLELCMPSQAHLGVDVQRVQSVAALNGDLLSKARAIKDYRMNQARCSYDIRSLGGAPIISAEEMLALDVAFTQLDEKYPEYAKIALIRYFIGLTVDEIAEKLCIKKATVERRLRMARCFLWKHMDECSWGTIYVQAGHIDLVRSLAASSGSGDSGTWLA